MSPSIHAVAHCAEALCIVFTLSLGFVASQDTTQRFRGCNDASRGGETLANEEGKRALLTGTMLKQIDPLVPLSPLITVLAWAK